MSGQSAHMHAAEAVVAPALAAADGAGAALTASAEGV